MTVVSETTRPRAYCTCGFSSTTSHLLFKHIRRWDPDTTGIHARAPGPRWAGASREPVLPCRHGCGWAGAPADLDAHYRRGCSPGAGLPRAARGVRGRLGV